MLINLFEIDGKNLVPSFACHEIKWLKVIMDTYKDNYIDVYKYIFFMSCPDGGINPYVNIAEDEKEEVIISDLSPLTFSLEDSMIIGAIQRCKKLYETPTLRILLSAKIMLDEMSEKLGTTSLTFGKDGNATDMRGIMKEIAAFTENYMSLEAMVIKEQSKVKGDKKIPYQQMEGYKETKNYD